MRRILGVLCILGCGSTSPTYLVSEFDLGRPDPEEAMRVSGLNLDGRISDRDDAEGCNKPDFTSPGPDFERGVDNQFGSLLDLAPNDPTAAVAPAIASGAFVLSIEVIGLDDRVQDDAVQVIVGGARFSGRVADGRLHAEGELLAFEMPVTDANEVDTVMPIRLVEPRVRMSITEDRVESGVLAGAMDVEEAIAGAIVLDFAPEEALRLVLGSNADLEPDGEGNCKKISSGFVFGARSMAEGG